MKSLCRPSLELLEARDLPANYFVSTAGLDTNPGTNALPWRTLQKAANTVDGGDTVTVRTGDYAGFDIRDKTTSSTNQILIQADPNVRIVSRNPVTTDGINLEGVSYITVTGFTVVGNGVDSATTNPMAHAGIRTVTATNVTLTNNTISGARYWGILTGFVNNLLIEGNSCSGSAREHGIYVGNSADNPIVRKNICFNNNGSGIQLNADRFATPGDGIITNALIDSNIVFGCGAGGGAALNMDGVQNSRFVNNLLYNNIATGIALFRQDGAEGSKNNVVVNNTIVQASNGRWAITIAGDGVQECTGNQVYNNVIFNRHSFRGAIDISAGSLPGFVSNYNVVISRFTTNRGNSVMNLAQWQTSTGQDINSIVSTEVAVFFNAGANDYRLKVGSPAFNAGTTLQSPVVDNIGVSRPANGMVDIGAFELPNPRLVSQFRINDGNAQRSMVRELVLTFDSIVAAPSTAFTLTRTGGGTAPTITANSATVNGRTVTTLTFSGSSTMNGSLIDGRWTLNTLGASITDEYGRALDGDANGTAGGNRTDNFFRLYGDGNGDATVNATDLILFRAALGSSTGSSSYRWFFDVNNDGAINAFDYTQLRANLGKTV